MKSKEEILKSGSVEVRIKVSGIIQRHVLKVEKEKTAFGLVPYCVLNARVSAGELVRIAEEVQLPVKCMGMKVFPRGKGASDFAEPESAPKQKGLAHSRLINGSDDEESEEENDEDESDSDDEESVEENEPAEDEEPDGKAPQEYEEEEEGEGEEKQPEGEEGPQKPEPSQHATIADNSQIEIEGSMEGETDAKKEEEAPKKRFSSGVLSEGILS